MAVCLDPLTNCAARGSPRGRHSRDRSLHPPQWRLRPVPDPRRVPRRREGGPPGSLHHAGDELVQGMIDFYRLEVGQAHRPVLAPPRLLRIAHGVSSYAERFPCGMMRGSAGPLSCSIRGFFRGFVRLHRDIPETKETKNPRVRGKQAFTTPFFVYFVR